MALHSPCCADEVALYKTIHCSYLCRTLKSILHLHSSGPHHESGWSRVTRDTEMVVKVMAAVETNPFKTATTCLINITGQCADSTVKDNWFEGSVRVTVQ